MRGDERVEERPRVGVEEGDERAKECARCRLLEPDEAWQQRNAHEGCCRTAAHLWLRRRLTRAEDGLVWERLDGELGARGAH